MNERIVIAPDSFKGVLSAPLAARCIAEGVRKAKPTVEIIEAPMADGGEGTLDVLLDALGGNRRRVPATGPLNDPVDVTVGLIRDASVAVVELAQVSGYTLVLPDRRDPLRSTTFGLGTVLRTVIESGIDEIILTLGGSATVDGGAGMMQALGLRLIDRGGQTIRNPVGGGDLTDIFRISWENPPENLDHVRFITAYDVLNPACGPNGAAAVFGPQKGADAEGVKRLEAGLSHWAGLLENASGRAIRQEPGTGAAGGVALPLLALTDSSMMPGVDLVIESNRLAERVVGADLLITGEGRLDGQSTMGKVVGSMGRLAKAAATPCVAIVGCLGPGWEACGSVLDAYYVLGGPLEETSERLRAAGQAVAEKWL